MVNPGFVGTPEATPCAADGGLDVEDPEGLVDLCLEQGKLAGVVTSWDITHAVSKGVCEELGLEKIMTRNVVYASPTDSILDIVRELEQNQISAMPVVEDGKVLGMINSDLLAHRYLLPYLESQAGG